MNKSYTNYLQLMLYIIHMAHITKLFKPELLRAISLVLDICKNVHNQHLCLYNLTDNMKYLLLVYTKSWTNCLYSWTVRKQVPK